MKFNSRQLQAQRWHWLNSSLPVRDDLYVQALADGDNMTQLYATCINLWPSNRVRGKKLKHHETRSFLFISPEELRSTCVTNGLAYRFDQRYETICTTMTFRSTNRHDRYGQRDAWCQGSADLRGRASLRVAELRSKT